MFIYIGNERKHTTHLFEKIKRQNFLTEKI